MKKDVTQDAGRTAIIAEEISKVLIDMVQRIDEADPENANTEVAKAHAEIERRIGDLNLTPQDAIALFGHFAKIGLTAPALQQVKDQMEEAGRRVRADAFESALFDLFVAAEKAKPGSVAEAFRYLDTKPFAAKTILAESFVQKALDARGEPQLHAAARAIPFVAEAIHFPMLQAIRTLLGHAGVDPKPQHAFNAHIAAIAGVAPQLVNTESGFMRNATCHINYDFDVATGTVEVFNVNMKGIETRRERVTTDDLARTAEALIAQATVKLIEAKAYFHWKVAPTG